MLHRAVRRVRPLTQTPPAPHQRPRHPTRRARTQEPSALCTPAEGEGCAVWLLARPSTTLNRAAERCPILTERSPSPLKRHCNLPVINMPSVAPHPPASRIAEKEVLFGMSANRHQGERLVTLVGFLLVLPISVFAITRTDSGVVQAAALLVALVFVGMIHLIGVWLFGQKD